MGFGVRCIGNVCNCLIPVLPRLSLNITINTRECFWLAATAQLIVAGRSWRVVTSRRGRFTSRETIPSID